MVKNKLGGGRRGKKATELCAASIFILPLQSSLLSWTQPSNNTTYLWFQIGIVSGSYLIIKLAVFWLSYSSVVAARRTGTHAKRNWYMHSDQMNQMVYQSLKSENKF